MFVGLSIYLPWTGNSKRCVRVSVCRGRSCSMCLRQIASFDVIRALKLRVPKTLVTTSGIHFGSRVCLGPQYKA